MLLLFLLLQAPTDDSANGDYGGFWTWPEIRERLDALVRAHPKILHRTSLGRTSEGRDIPLFKVSDRAAEDEDEPELLLMAGIHPREQQPQIAIMNLLGELVEGYGRDDRITKLVDGREIWIIPVFNVDGKVHDMKHGNGTDKGANWRKNRRANPDGTFGVDLNRNFTVRWGGSTDEEKSDVYEGPHPLSEPETRALARFFDERPLRAFADVHSTMKAILHFPYMIPSDGARYEAISKSMRALQKEPYRATEPIVDADPAAVRTGNTGLSNAWAYGTRGVYSFIFEIAGRGFYDRPGNVQTEYETNVRGPLLHLIEACAELPLPRAGSAVLKGGQLKGKPAPGAAFAWTPEVEGPCAYAVLVSEGSLLQVTSEFRHVPFRSGFNLQVSRDARAGDRAPLVLYLWDGERGRSVATVELTIEAP